MTVEVALPLPLDQTYTYRVPDALEGRAPQGTRVLVPFGGRRLTGIAVGEGAPPETLDFELKEVERILDERPALTPELLDLTRWMADYYVCGWGEVLKAALPAGTASTDSGDAQVTPKREAHLRLAPVFRSEGAVRDLKEQLRGHKQRAVIEVLSGLAAEGTLEPRQADVKARAEAASSTVLSLLDKGVIERLDKEVRRSPLHDLPPPGEPPDHRLHTAQKQAAREVRIAAEEETYVTFLLHGVTGSGKTAVYVKALEAALERGKTGIILVPEIALTPQTVQRFRAHFPGEVAVLHSQMSQGERYDMWRGLRDGHFHVAIGPRSAVLAPLENVGVIVVDEEHESTYKQFDPAPRYHARDVAVMRASMTDAVCILGSATPSLESLHNAQQDKYRLLEMPDRVRVPGRPESDASASGLPEVRIVDLTRERRKHRLDGTLSVPLQEAIHERLHREEQVLLLLNRRGYAPVVECEACGAAPTCPDCSVTLTYHKAQGRLRCHYCGRARRLPPACDACGEPALSQIGTGTQRVEEELTAAFPEARVLRMDRDTTRRKGAHRRLLHRFGNGNADILLGTQMIAKGLDFSRVTLVGVVDADVGLLLPDFRAEERTFQLLMQVAGRAGRAELAGEVLLQTRNPKHTAVQHACAHDYHSFAASALEERRLFSYPPFGRLAGIGFRGPKKEAAAQLAKTWTAVLRQYLPDQAEVLGPEPSFIARVKRQYRFHTLVKVPPACIAAVQSALRRTSADQGTPKRGYHVSIDVDPVGLF